MKRIKKLIAVIVIMAVVCSMAAACSGSKSSPAGTGSSTTGNSAQTTTTADPGANSETKATATEAAEKKEDAPLTVVFAQNADPTSIDPHKVGGDNGANVHRQITEPLTKFDENWQLQPWLAESWENPDELTWVFHLKEGVFFSDGEKFNAEAVVWNLNHGADKNYPRQAMEYINVYESSEATDEYTVTVHLTAKCDLFANYMADMECMAPEYMEKVGEEGSSRDICGTGPYILKSWVPDQQITLEKNVNYWRGEPEVDTYIIKTIPEESTMIAELLNGTVDVVSNISFEYMDMLNAGNVASAYSKLERRVIYIGFNTTDWTPNPELKDVRVRQALNYAVDIQAIINTVMGGYGKKLGSFWRQDFTPYNKELESYYTYNPEKAKELLKEAGYENGFTITCQSHTGSTAKQHEICQAIAKYLADVNVTMIVEPVEYNTMRGIVINGQAQQAVAGLFTWSWAGKPGLTDSWLTGIIKSNGMSSYNGIEGYDELCDKILAIGKLEDRADLYLELQQKLVDDPPYLYLWQLESIYGVSNRLNWDPNSFMYIEAFDMHAAS